jgi:uridine phosphorylase
VERVIMPPSGRPEYFGDASCVSCGTCSALFEAGDPSNDVVADLNDGLTPGSPIIDNTKMAADDNSLFVPPILAGKEFAASSVFEPANLLREARRQKSIAKADVPEICVLDPDGDILRLLRCEGRVSLSTAWACYHTELYEFGDEQEHFGIIGCAVGASFAVLLAEQLFVSGCRFLLSVTSAGQIVAQGPPPYFVVIDRALRDEGTSYHYLPPAEFSEADPALLGTVMAALRDHQSQVYCGATWTTDAPFRETAGVIERCRERGILAVEMEAAALYAFAQARRKPVLCLAHVTNQMAVSGSDFEKGEADGAYASLAVISVVARAWRALERPPA